MIIKPAKFFLVMSNTFAGCLIFTRPTDGIPRDARAVEVTVIHYDLMRNCTEATRVVIRGSRPGSQFWDTMQASGGV
ncbi:MAG: hypothetical protein OEZ54_06765, partial [Gemmatimonadota bacterium]|nr:hypothetical protein [Gemmatimonadota bacterium]